MMGFKAKELWNKDGLTVVLENNDGI